MSGYLNMSKVGNMHTKYAASNDRVMTHRCASSKPHEESI